MADLFREIDEDLRAEQVGRLVRRYGWVAALLLVVVIAGVGGWQALAWQHRQATARLSAAYLQATKVADAVPADAMNRGTPETAQKRDAALAAFAPLESAGQAQIRALARLRVAQLLTDKGDLAGAIRRLDAVAADPEAERTFRDVAVLFAVERQLGSGEPAALKTRLATIEEPDGAFRALAIETEAAIDLRAGHADAARAALERALADPSAPQTARERISTLLQALGAGGTAGDQG